MSETRAWFAAAQIADAMPPEDGNIASLISKAARADLALVQAMSRRALSQLDTFESYYGGDGAARVLFCLFMAAQCEIGDA